MFSISETLKQRRNRESCYNIVSLLHEIFKPFCLIQNLIRCDLQPHSTPLSLIIFVTWLFSHIHQCIKSHNITYGVRKRLFIFQSLTSCLDHSENNAPYIIAKHFAVEIVDWMVHHCLCQLFAINIHLQSTSKYHM